MNEITITVIIRPGGSAQPSIPPASLRKLINRLLVSDTDLDAFCIDHFAKVKKRFASGMEMKAKVNMLLENVDPEEIFSRLQEEFPEYQDFLQGWPWS